MPRPAAARYQRHGPWYTADLLTQRERDITPLSTRLSREPVDDDFWRGIGEGLRRFHDAGVYHADLNAYNVQVDAADEVFLLDFDRGEIWSRGEWQAGNLERLHRSLCKLAGLDSTLRFEDESWNALLQGYLGNKPSKP